MQVWRLIPLLTASGALQMAIDAWLLDQHCHHQHPPTLRFYQWEPIALSLGFHQQQIPLHWQELTWQGKPLEIVRRPTGGRAVLHQGDLTYAVVTSGLVGNRMQVYQTLCQFLIEGWRSLGVDLQYGQAGRGYIHNPNCFGTATVADLTLADGAKLIGSAQLRRKQAVLQQGSMRLQQDPELFRRVFNEFPHLPHLPPQFHDPAGIPAIVQALTQAASQCFQVKFQLEPLSEPEWAAIRAFQLNQD